MIHAQVAMSFPIRNTRKCAARASRYKHKQITHTGPVGAFFLMHTLLVDHVRCSLGAMRETVRTVAVSASGPPPPRARRWPPPPDPAPAGRWLLPLPRPRRAAGAPG